jgi:hypothetical protein
VALKADCELYYGRQLLVEPEHGYGWNSQVTSPYREVEVPAKFHFVVDRFFHFGGALMGGIGTIQEPGHALDGLRLGFSARHTAERDFVEDPVTCNLTVGSETRESANGWLLAVGPPALVGFGKVRDDAV